MARLCHFHFRVIILRPGGSGKIADVTARPSITVCNLEVSGNFATMVVGRFLPRDIATPSCKLPGPRIT